MQWSFPSTKNGQIKGVADAGIETFQGDGIKALTRETCQNSLDAVVDDNKTVHVQFKQYYKKTKTIPGYIKYKSMLRQILNYWKGNSEKATEFLERAIQSMEEEYTNILRISDYNTSGLSEPYKAGFGSWNALTKIDGGATKTGDSAGSFGIGKNAPYVCTAYRMVFYRTINVDGECAAQGISRLLSCELEKKGEFTTGTGYYGNCETNGPVGCIPELDELEIRKEIGTDIFVYGLSVINTKEIKNAIYIEVLNNFLMSIYREKISVAFADEIIDAESIGEYISEYKSKIKDSYCTWLALVNSLAEEVYMNFHDLGTLRLRILVNNEEKLNRKVLVTRKSGMKLFFMTGISKTISFTGILELEGEELNKFFRDMETPAHDKWKPENHNNPQKAKEYIKEIRNWVTEQVNLIGEEEYSDERDVIGLAATLNEQSVESASSKERNEGINNFLGDIKIIKRDIPNYTQGFFVATSEVNSKSKDIVGGNSGGNNHRAKGVLDDNGNAAAVRTLKGTRQRKTIQKHKGHKDNNGEDIVLQGDGKGKMCPLEYVRVIKISINKYKVSFIIPYFVSNGYMEIVTVGENGKSTKLNIVAASAVHSCKCIKVRNGIVELQDMAGKEKVQIMFELADSRSYAMEVRVYEYN